MKLATLAAAVGTIVLANRVVATESSKPFLHVPEVHAQRIRGQGVTVAVIDTGIYLNEQAFPGQIAPGGISWVNGHAQEDGGGDVYADGRGPYVSLMIAGPQGVVSAVRRFCLTTGPSPGIVTVKAIQSVVTGILVGGDAIRARGIEAARAPGTCSKGTQT